MLYNQIFWTALSLSVILMAQKANGGNVLRAQKSSEGPSQIAYSDSENDITEASSEEPPHITYSDSEDGIIKLSLSQATVFLIKMDKFFSKCELISDDNSTRICLKELKIVDLRNIFLQNSIQNDQQSVPDQQKPSSSKHSESDLKKKMIARVVDSDQLMKLFIVKSMQTLDNPSNSLEQLRKKFTNFLKFFDLFPNVFGTKAIKELTTEQNLLILHELLLLSIDYAQQIYEKIYDKNKEMKLKLYGKQYPLLSFKFYKNWEEKFNAISLEISKILFDDFGRKVDPFSNIFSDLKRQIKLIDREETKPEKLNFQISMQNIAQMLAKIGLFIFSNCNNQHLWYFENESEEIKNCANRINFDELAKNFPKNEQKKLFNLFVNALYSEETINRAKILEMLRQLNPFDEPILDKIFHYYNNNKFSISILIGLLQFGRMFTEKFGIYAVKLLYLGLNVEMVWKDIKIHINMYDHPGEEMEALEYSLISAGLI